MILLHFCYTFIYRYETLLIYCSPVIFSVESADLWFFCKTYKYWILFLYNNKSIKVEMKVIEDLSSSLREEIRMQDSCGTFEVGPVRIPASTWPSYIALSYLILFFASTRPQCFLIKQRFVYHPTNSVLLEALENTLFMNELNKTLHQHTHVWF